MVFRFWSYLPWFIIWLRIKFVSNYFINAINQSIFQFDYWNLQNSCFTISSQMVLHMVHVCQNLGAHEGHTCNLYHVKPSVWYLNKNYILIHQTYKIALNVHYFFEFMKNAPCGNSKLMLCMSLEVHSELMLADGFLHVSNVFLFLRHLEWHQLKPWYFTP